MRILLTCLACFTLAACINHVPQPEVPVPAQMIQDYVGQSQKYLLYHLGQPDSLSSDGVESRLLYHWQTRDGVISPRLENAWRGNTAFTQRQLPTRANPMRDGCDIIFITQNDVVTSATPKGSCW